ncbi:MAG: hypothetical protein ABW199_10450 [Caulobacterales bacterium]
MSRYRDDVALKPIGLALTAVVAGLGVAVAQSAPLAETASIRPFTPDDTLKEPSELVIGPSEAVEPFSEQNDTQTLQQDLFEL